MGRKVVLQTLPGGYQLVTICLQRTQTGTYLGVWIAAGCFSPKGERPAGVARKGPEMGGRKAAAHRGVIDQLKDLFALERHHAKTLEGLLTRLAAKIAAYTCGQALNTGLGRPLRHLADLLV
jgi:hypothetical protein